MIKKFKYYDLFKNVLVIIPHGGTLCPIEISTKSLSKYQDELASECIDWHTEQLYDFRDMMNNKQIVNPISNVYLNVNRHPDMVMNVFLIIMKKYQFIKMVKPQVKN